MDLEQRQVIDLLPMRSADRFADWLKKHPEVELITRDRSGLYADGGRHGAPSATQITDRYHLMSNLSEPWSGISSNCKAKRERY
jgi:transposase